MMVTEQTKGSQEPVPQSGPRLLTLARMADALLAAVLLAGFVAFYFYGQTARLTVDSCSTIGAIVNGNRNLVYVHHLLYDPLLKLCTLLFTPGGSIDAKVSLMQKITALFSAASIPILFLTLRAGGVGRILAGLFSLFLGFSAGMNMFASQVEPYGWSCLLLGMTMMGMILSRRDPRADWLTAAGWALAMFIHQNNIFFGVAIAVDGLLRCGPLRQRCKRLVISLLAPLALTGAVFAGTALALGVRGLSGFIEWLTFYANMGIWGKGTASLNIVTQCGQGFYQALFNNYTATPAQQRLFPYAFGALMLAALPGVPAAWKHQRALLLAMLAWLIVFGGFNAWWEAGNREGWIPWTTGLLLVLALLAPSKPKGLWNVQWALMVIALMLCVLPQAQGALQMAKIERTPSTPWQDVKLWTTLTRDADVVITAGEMRDYLAKAYVDQPNTQVCDILKLQAEVLHDAQTTAEQLAAITQWVTGKVQQEHAAGKRVFLDAVFFERDPNPWMYPQYWLDLSDQLGGALAQNLELTPISGVNGKLLLTLARPRP